MAKIREDGFLEYNNITKSVVVQANYLASMQDKYIVDDGISFYTGCMPWNWGTPGVSHTEWGCWLDDELWFFSSTSRKELGDNGNGTRWKKGKELLNDPERWQLQDIESNHIGQQICRANSMIGLSYDFYGVGADFVNPIRVFIKLPLRIMIGVIKKIYCSKAVHAVFTGTLAVYSPRRQWRWAKNNGFKIIKDTALYLKGDIMSRTRREKKVKHCTVTGCDICEANRLYEEQNREFKTKKQILKAKGDSNE